MATASISNENASRIINVFADRRVCVVKTIGTTEGVD